jgi:ribosomal protein S12 methylthiotransferase
MVSLGCPKALVDSERILTKLRSDGYALSPDYDDADVVLVNTCGFLDSAKEESLAAIGEAIAENGRVIVTGCMGKEADVIRERFPSVLAVTGPAQYEQVVGAVHEAAPMPPSAFLNLVPEGGLKLTPRHYSYLKISEGCNHRCSFCIIPSLRGDQLLRLAKDGVGPPRARRSCWSSARTPRLTASTSATSRAPGRAARCGRT